MNTQRFSDALDICKAVFYDLNASKMRFSFRSLPNDKQMIFTAVECADIVKAKFSQFEIKLDSRQTRYAELVINYE